MSMRRLTAFHAAPCLANAKSVFAVPMPPFLNRP